MEPKVDQKRSINSIKKDRSIVNSSLVSEELAGILAPSYGISYSPNGKTLALADGQFIRILKSNTNSTKFEDVADYGWDFCDADTISFYPDGQFVIAGYEENKTLRLGIFKIQKKELEQVYETFWSRLNSISCSPDGTYIAIGDGFGLTILGIEGGLESTLKNLETWENRSGIKQLTDAILRRTPPVGLDNVVSHEEIDSSMLDVAFSSDSKYIAVAEKYTPHLKIFEFDGTNLTKISEKECPTNIYAVAFSPDRKYIGLGQEGYLSIRKFDKGNIKNEVFRVELPLEDVCCSKTCEKRPAIIEGISFSPDGKYVAVCSGFDQDSRIYKIPLEIE